MTASVSADIPWGGDRVGLVAGADSERFGVRVAAHGVRMAGVTWPKAEANSGLAVLTIAVAGTPLRSAAFRRQLPTPAAVSGWPGGRANATIADGR
ncbi:MAG: hypothetical protein ACHREM_13620 [Polyangiales bacterium]